MCHYEARGTYTVRSECRLALSLKIDHKNSALTSSNVTVQIWKSMWKLLTPSKVVNFKWRATLNILPTRELLSSRLSNVDSSYPFCGHEESVVHLCRDCAQFREVWTSCGFPWLSSIKGITFKLWWAALVDSCTREELFRIACVCFFIWYGRNHFAFENQQWSVHEILCRAGMIR
ncbi:hypothetical protein P3X46_010336 [Hevea brasiliensis]|uniref:Reverse transcriptase zinc-binding domain-containing protein n=1 Tax=Hevea brasiliensis TaxID=3981 RepID=A0ABQ9MDR7_HEVBR|nr:hypothetical protein P3X46_010336 [Hevea brasiliensis]